MPKKTTQGIAAARKWPLVLAVICTLAFPLPHSGAQTDKREIVRKGAQSYYSLRRLGLIEFKANVQPNWASMIKNSEVNPEGLKMLNSLIFSLSLNPDGNIKLQHDSAVPIPEGQTENVKQIYAGLNETLTGIFLTWNLFMLSSPFPAPESEYQLQDLDGKYLLTYREGNADISTTMTRELAITEIKVSAKAFKASIKPELTKTQRGYVLAGYQGSYEPMAGPGKATLVIAIEYQEVNGLQLPRKFSLASTYDEKPAQMEFQFSQYQLKLAESGVNKKANQN